ncbi:MAG TPA: hypothetical protein VK970_23335 [Candidatus Methylacidiphilales bacterium]|nr:hypothetical protein [Candidatus Methylacidiphilales bacterium]
MESSSKDQLLHAQTLETAGDLPSAYKAYKGLARKWPRSYSAPEAHFKMAWLELRSGSPYMALKTALKLMIDYPGSVFAWYAMFITIVVVAGLILITYAVTRRGLRRIKPKPEPEPALT